MKTKKTLIYLAVMLVFYMATVGCNNSTTSSNTENNNSGGDGITIVP